MSASLSFHGQFAERTPYAAFLKLCPGIVRHARVVFRRYAALDQEELVAETVATAFVNYVALTAQDREPAHFPSLLATFATLRVLDDRHIGGRRNSRDVLARAAQQRHGFRVRSLPRYDTTWADAFVTDDTPVLDQVVFRIDVPEFLHRLSERDRQIAQALALGHAAVAVARQFGVSPGRVTQLRQKWADEWRVFHKETPTSNS